MLGCVLFTGLWLFGEHGLSVCFGSGDWAEEGRGGGFR